MFDDSNKVTGDVDVLPLPVGKDDRTKKEKPFWLNAWRDHLAGIKAFTGCLDLADLNGDGDWKILIGDAKRLKIFSGTSLATENPLVGVPTAVVSFHMDYRDAAHRPNIAVATGPFIYIYKNLRPFYKFTLPPVSLTKVEMDLWAALKDENIGVEEAFEQIKGLRDEGVHLSTHSQDLLSLDSPNARQLFVDSHSKQPLSQKTVITCMSVLLKDKDETGALGCLVVGTEDRHILILESSGVSIAKRIQIPCTPVQIMPAGLHDVEYRLIIMTRSGTIYIIKNGTLQTGATIESEAQPVAIARYENVVAVATMSHSLDFYNVKGKKQYSVLMPCAITNMCSVFNECTRQSKAVIVALSNGEIRVYVGKSLINKTQVFDQVIAMKYGRYGREDATLVVILKSGAILLKMLPRTAKLETNSAKAAYPTEQDVPIKIPKRTNVYIAQTEREKQFGTDMHRVFQHGLCKLRLTTARAFVNMLTDGKGTTNYSANCSIRVTANVQGLGPMFKYRLNVQNFSCKALTGIHVVFLYNPNIYRILMPFLTIPCLVPSLIYIFDVAIENIDPNGVTEPIKVCVCDPVSAGVILTVIISPPPIDLVIE
eukprot:Tbor_TRINITY_DN5007_c0_g1::TRINITY_DN5007_c0_g1_i1::g.14260::m.14260/K16746/BBS1; Bardet-Biedl syndrome 1 protein